jgi:hypothetical protein
MVPYGEVGRTERLSNGRGALVQEVEVPTDHPQASPIGRYRQSLFLLAPIGVCDRAEPDSPLANSRANIGLR